MKIKYLALVNRYGETPELVEQFSFNSNVRLSPGVDIANSIFLISFPDGEFGFSNYLVKMIGVREDGTILYNIVTGNINNRQIVVEEITGEELLGINVTTLESNLKSSNKKMCSCK